MTAAAADLFKTNLRDMAQLSEAMTGLTQEVTRAAALLEKALVGGRKLLCCGNGGSACDAAHFAAEITGRFKLERRGFPAVDLTADHALLTALINDFPPEDVFARQVVAHGVDGDVLCVFSSSGNSENIRRALVTAKGQGLQAVAFLGKGGGICRGIAEVDFVVPHDTTARVQEMHLLLYHTLCEAIDPVLAGR